MSFPSPSSPPRVLCVIGPTGCGKSSFAISLSLSLSSLEGNFHCEVISIDSMQIYSEIPIGSNHITPAECRGIRHHFVGIASAGHVIPVPSLVSTARKLIADIWRRGKIPLLVGGTHYWMEAILMKEFTLEEGGERGGDDGGQGEGKIAENHWGEKFHSLWNSKLNDAFHRAFLSFSSLDEDDQKTLCEEIENLNLPSSSSSPFPSPSPSLPNEKSQKKYQKPPDPWASYGVVPSALQKELNEIKEKAEEIVQSISHENTESVSMDFPVSCCLHSLLSPLLNSPIFLSSVSSPTLHSFLQIVDPPVSSKLHFKDHRKVLRALGDFVTKGVRRDEWMKREGRKALPTAFEERGAVTTHGESTESTESPFLFDVQIFCLHCPMEILSDRLDRRVDQMIQRGLLSECQSLWNLLGEFSKKYTEYTDQWKSKGKSLHPSLRPPSLPSFDIDCEFCQSLSGHADSLPLSESSNSPLSSAMEKFDWTRGILQSLGLKEFKEFLKSSPPTNSSSPSSSPSPSLSPLFSSCVSSLKISTRRYAKKQSQWVRKRFHAIRNASIIDIDTSNADEKSLRDTANKWADTVKTFINEGKSKDQREGMGKGGEEIERKGLGNEWHKIVCSDCDRVVNGPHEWSLHLSSNSHQRNAESKRKEKRKRQMEMQSIVREQRENKRKLKEQNQHKTQIQMETEETEKHQ